VRLFLGDETDSLVDDHLEEVCVLPMTEVSFDLSDESVKLKSLVFLYTGCS
jgi:hypothetical protein